MTGEPTTNPRGIPVFPFLPHVTDYVKSPSETEQTLARFQEMIQKYNFMQSNVERRAQGLKEKLPEMKRTLDTVRFLVKQKNDSTNPSSEEDDLDSDPDAETSQNGVIETTFPLQDTLFAHATINTQTLEEVYLWLGANVMVAYPLLEAEELLAGKLAKAKESLKAAEEDLEFLRIQVTTLEVATARVHNWDVGEKRKIKEKEAGKKK